MGTSMNGHEWTACFAKAMLNEWSHCMTKGYINNKHKWTKPLTATFLPLWYTPAEHFWEFTDWGELHR